MSSSNQSGSVGSFIENWWPFLVILFGVMFVTLLVSFKPSW